jgi:hypothetical protein
MRLSAFALLLTFALAPAALRAASPAANAFDPSELATLQLKAEHAALRDQAFLYSELMNRFGALATHQISAGSSTEAAASLARVEQLATLIDSGISHDTRKLREAEILMRETVVRLQEALHQASLDDRPGVQHTLTEVDHLESKLMEQVFQH